MSIRQCPNAHFYDDAKYAVCPVCALQAQGALADCGKTVGVQPIGPALDGRTLAYSPFQDDPFASPVAGWLVCIAGAERGRDWRLVSGRNFAGGTPGADIFLAELAQEDKLFFTVIYDDRHDKFLVMPEAGVLVYLNGALLSAPAELADDDEIRVEGVILCFRSFCRGTRRW